ncbi:MAG: nuclear transport factor 2 family protein [Gemmatimonadota bacterium]|nr:nuclear transport factor 2 family protein [Gemmatimonadota bacterium]
MALRADGASAQPGGASANADERAFHDLILRRRVAYGHGDTAAYGRLVSPDVVHIDDRGNRRNRAVLMQFVLANVGSRARYEVGVVHVRHAGALVIADCDVTEYIPFGPREQMIAAHESNVFERRDGRWLLLQHSEAPILSQPARIALDSMTLEQYVGRYEWYPGYVDTISRRGARLFIQSTGEAEPTALTAAGNDAFFVDGDPTVGFFVRDSTGRVSKELVHFLDGRLVIARRVP